MIGLRTKREEKFPSANSEGLIVLLNSAIKSSLWRETNKAKIATIQQLCEFLKTVTQERLESLQD